jgi:hypothetical protein
MFHSAKDNATPQKEWEGIVTNNPLTRIPIAWFWDTFGKDQVAHQLALAHNDTFSHNSFMSTNGMKVIGQTYHAWNVPTRYPTDQGVPELNKGLAWKDSLNVQNLAGTKEYGVDWIHGTNQIQNNVPHLRSRDRRNVSPRD